MKRINPIIFLVTMVGYLWSCTEEIGPFLSETPVAPVWISPEAGGSMVLSEDLAEEEVVFEFQSADFGFSAAVAYTVEMDMAGNSFAAPTAVVTSRGTQAVLSITDFNQRLIGKGLVPDEASEIELRIRAAISDRVEDVFSEPIAMTVTPYEVALDYPKLYVPGDYQGWNPANENTVIYSVNSDGIYEGFIHVLQGSGTFKVNEGPNWDVNYGDNEGDGTLDQDGTDLSVGDEYGTFKLTVDLNNMTYSIGPALLWGIIGDATPGGWDVSTPMEFDADENVLTLTTDLNAGLIKFRANDAWDNNYGDDDGDGIAEAGGADITVEEAGNYTITLDFKVPGQVSYTLEKN